VTDQRRQAILALIAAQVQLQMTDHALKQYVLAMDAQLAEGTIRRILQGKDHHVSKLAALAESMDCDLVIELRPRKVA
jgi:hypothetical protein